MLRRSRTHTPPPQIHRTTVKPPNDSELHEQSSPVVQDRPPCVAWSQGYFSRLARFASLVGTYFSKFSSIAGLVCTRCLGFVLVPLTLTLITMETCVYFKSVVPRLRRLGSFWKCLLITLLGLFLVGNLLYNYILTVCSDPSAPYVAEELALNLDADNTQRISDGVKTCTKCSRLKPPRAHHCRICKRCVLKMDHHCPWVGNCVGFANYRHFCLFLLYLDASCLFVLQVYDWIDMFEFVCWIISAMALAGTSLLGTFHVFLVLTNQTTIECDACDCGNWCRPWKLWLLGSRDYDRGLSQNFQEVFGPNNVFGFLWLMPYIAKPPIGDGMVFGSVAPQVPVASEVTRNDASTAQLMTEASTEMQSQMAAKTAEAIAHNSF